MADEVEMLAALGHGAGVMSRRTLLGVWAHPDDEAYLSAGLMAEHRRRGDRVVVVTATLGEHGTSDPDAWPPAPAGAGARRRAPATASPRSAVHELRLLGYDDGDCSRHDGTRRHRRPDRGHRP